MIALSALTKAKLEAVLAVGNGRCPYLVVVEPGELAAARAYIRGRRNCASVKLEEAAPPHSCR